MLWLLKYSQHWFSTKTKSHSLIMRRHFSWLIYLPICGSNNIEMTFTMFRYVIHQLKWTICFNLIARHFVFASTLSLPCNDIFLHICFKMISNLYDIWYLMVLRHILKSICISFIYLNKMYLLRVPYVSVNYFGSGNGMLKRLTWSLIYIIVLTL